MNKVERMNRIKENAIMYINKFNNCENGYAILQLPIDVIYKFRDYEDVTTFLKKEPDRADYEILYADRCMGLENPTTKEINEILEGIFTRFNCDIPTDYFGTSLSVSDVVVIKLNNEVTAYYVDTFGFKKLENFEF